MADGMRRMREAAERVFRVMWDRKSRKEREWRMYRDNYAPSRGLFSSYEGEDNKGKGAVRGNSFPTTILEESEKAYILAPVTMRQTSEVLDKCIIRIFNIMLRAGRFPPPPPELAGTDIRIEYVSEFALLQKRAAREGIAELIAVSGQLAQLEAAAGRAPESLDRIDADEVIETVSEMYGIESGIVLGDDAVAEIRAARAEQARQAELRARMEQTVQALPAGAKAAKDLSETRVGGTSALDALLAPTGDRI